MIKIFQRLMAFFRRTFFTDCPRCHNYFHGKQNYGIQLKFERHYRVVCHNCAIEHKSLDKVM